MIIFFLFMLDLPLHVTAALRRLFSLMDPASSLEGPLHDRQEAGLVPGRMARAVR
jgi:hypothetical protein